jgi:hypothetical protein
VDDVTEQRKIGVVRRTSGDLQWGERGETEGRDRGERQREDIERNCP